MNRYEILGLVTDAQHGHTIAVIPEHRNDVAKVLRAAYFEGDVTRMSQASGREAVWFTSGGCIQFFYDSLALRGACFSIVAVYESLIRTGNVGYDISPCVHPDGEIILI